MPNEKYRFHKFSARNFVISSGTQFCFAFLLHRFRPLPTCQSMDNQSNQSSRDSKVLICIFNCSHHFAVPSVAGRHKVISATLSEEYILSTSCPHHDSIRLYDLCDFIFQIIQFRTPQIPQTEQTNMNFCDFLMRSVTQ